MRCWTWFPCPLPTSSHAQRDESVTKGEELRKEALGDEYARLLSDLSCRTAICRPAPAALKPSEREAVIPDLAPIDNQVVLTIPKDAAQKDDLSFLEGCWTSDTKLVETAKGGSISVEYCFDRRGSGHRFVHTGNESCMGKATARFRGSSLTMKTSAATCPGGTQEYVPQEIECTGSEDTTRCRGLEKKRNKTTRWQARFVRK